MSIVVHPLAHASSSHVVWFAGDWGGKHTSTSSKSGKSLHRLRHPNGFQIPDMPTQYAISANRAASSSSAKSAAEMVLSLLPPAATAAQVAVSRRSAVGMRILMAVAEALHGKLVDVE